MAFADLPRLSFHAFALILVGAANGLLLTKQCFIQPPCTCYSNGVDCEDKNIDFIPTIDPVDWSRPFIGLHFGGNNLTTIEDNTFMNININSSSDVSLYLENNAISSISDSSFNGIESSVYSINLTNNKLTSIPRAFANLTKLDELYLRGNPIKTLDSYTMKLLGMHLVALEISMASFNRWPSELRFLRRMSSLYIFDIPFYNLHYDAFQGMETSLLSLAMINTNFDQLPLALCHLRSLNKFYFEDNKQLVDKRVFIESCIMDLIYLSKQTKLSFRNNSLIEFPKVLHNASEYYQVDVGNNDIEFIEEDTIPHCKVTKMILDHNKITRIPYALNNLMSVKKLDLSHNSISMVGEPDVQHLVSLESLYLSNNRLMFVNSKTFIHNIHLKHLDIANNMLKTVPGALALGQALATVELGGNAIDCTCLEFDISSLKISSMKINGFCEFGTESLQSFLSIATARCP